jgi:hypothetical protein
MGKRRHTGRQRPDTHDMVKDMTGHRSAGRPERAAISVIALGFFLSAFGDPNAAAKPATLAGGAGTQPRTQPASARPPEAASGFVRIDPEDLRPAFTRETVIRLNAIVRRSLEAIEEYDDAIGEIRASARAAGRDGATGTIRRDAERGLAQLRDLSARSRSALRDMNAEITRLEGSGETYNKTILAGMAHFVRTVESEIRAEKEQITAQLAATD